MKSFIKHFLNQTGIKGLLIGVAIVVPVWTWQWSRDDGSFNPTMIYIGVGVVLFVMLCEWISLKVRGR